MVCSPALLQISLRRNQARKSASPSGDKTTITFSPAASIVYFSSKEKTERGLEALRLDRFTGALQQIGQELAYQVAAFFLADRMRRGDMVGLRHGRTISLLARKMQAPSSALAAACGEALSLKP